MTANRIFKRETNFVMTENMLRGLPQKTLLNMALAAIDDFMALLNKGDVESLQQKKDELIMLNNVIKERKTVLEGLINGPDLSNPGKRPPE